MTRTCLAFKDYSLPFHGSFEFEVRSCFGNPQRVKAGESVARLDEILECETGKRYNQFPRHPVLAAVILLSASLIPIPSEQWSRLASRCRLSKSHLQVGQPRRLP